MKATEFLQAAIDTQAERGKQYDSPEGERSMGRTVQAFNAITGRDLTEAEGWLLLQLLKDVRQWQNPDKYHHDSVLDGVAYASLKAEALSGDYAGEATAPPQWIERDGGLMPVAEGTELVVRYRAGDEKAARAGFSYAAMWDHTGHPYDIVAYRLG